MGLKKMFAIFLFSFLFTNINIDLLALQNNELFLKKYTFKFPLMLCYY